MSAGAGERPVADLTCQDVVGLLVDYLERTLGDDLVTAFERHLEDCEPCRAYLATYRATRELTGRANRAGMPAELCERLRTFLLRVIEQGAR